MTQSVEELSSIYLESTESDLESTQHFNVSLTSVEPSNALPLTTSSSGVQEHFRIPEAGENQNVIIELNVPTLQMEDGNAPEQTHPQDELQQQVEEATVKQPRRKRITYDYIPADIKRKIVEYAGKHGTRPAAQLFDINEPTIRYWKQKGFAISRGRKVSYGEELDKQLHVGLMELKSSGNAVTVDQFTDYAKKIIDEKRPDLNFKCSRGWLEKFFKRHNLEVVKSPSGKVMNIVESAKDADASLLLQMDEGDDEDDDGDEEDSSDVNANLEESYVSGSSAGNSSEHLVEQNMSEELSPPAKRMRLVDFTADQAGAEAAHPLLPSSSTTDSPGAENQRGKMLHVADILKKLKGNRPPLTNYQKQEVIDHARQNGSRSAERKFGVPETTIRYWVKKSVVTPQIVSLSTANPFPSLSTSHHPMNSNTSATNFTLAGNTSTSSVQGNAEELQSSVAPQNNVDSSQVLSRSDAVAACQILHWAISQTLHNETVSFDELCDRALAYISQTNPSSAYSSTRKWVKQILGLKVRDLLNILD